MGKHARSADLLQREISREKTARSTNAPNQAANRLLGAQCIVHTAQAGDRQLLERASTKQFSNRKFLEKVSVLIGVHSAKFVQQSSAKSKAAC